jgi:hypothetical protein
LHVGDPTLAAVLVHSRRIHLAGVWAVSIGGVTMVVGMFGPWVRSGAASRSSFEMLDLIERLGFARGGPVGLVVRVWPLAPLLVVSAVVLTWWMGGRAAAIVAMAAGTVVGGVGLAIQAAPESSLVGVRWGAAMTAVGGLVTLIGGALGLASSRPSAVPDAAALEDLA